MRVGSPRRPLVSSRFGGKTQTSSRREGEWLKRADRSMSPPGDWELNWGVTRPFCQLHIASRGKKNSKIIVITVYLGLRGSPSYRVGQNTGPQTRDHRPNSVSSQPI